ncbi:MAG: porin family protein [Bradyrhizobium sp.]|uniref:outer membrane protein n=1 Tax=Bradyrhizobium sp. TaxID=376 RepID=UPI001C2990C9|nr:outer membrane protein [Bradyrhizobium sp.]MBU6461406.1 porin family protein [Pseudomonadota bacterium]MDE2067971.1 porin family protein [Bradyrhizobium sp.]MDE2241527.1 porin family protein [Bradyrhizobium sp.]MDE2469265.1 porin family protein [Bradyrhizobium sp.]
MKLIVAVLAGLFGTASALAADLPARIYTKAPVMADPGYNWSGFYLGGNVGYSWGRSNDTSTLTNGAGTTLFTSIGSSDLDGVVGGGQIGYNWQIQNWVWGLEADIQGTGERGSRDFTCPTGVCTPATTTTIPGIGVFPVPGAAVPVSLEQKIEWFGTVRGRVGVLATPRVLFYATGGLAYGEVGTDETINTTSLFSNSDTRFGYTVGAGVEGALGGNWTAKLEYLYVDLGRTSGSFATTIAALGGGTLTSSYSSRITDNILRVGLNYRFNSGPVVARY